MKKNSKIILIIVLVIFVFLIFFGFFVYKQNKLEKDKKRLIEVSISREIYFWECFNKKINEETNKWNNLESTKDGEIKYNQCLEASKNGNNYNFGINFEILNENAGRITRCRSLMPSRPWELHNELASKYCSEEADKTQDGILVKKLRKKVPFEVLTDNELINIVKEKRK